MKPCSCLLVLVILFLTISLAPARIKRKHDKVVACYVASWAFYRNNDGKFEMKNLRPDLCTHFIYAFAGLNQTSWTIRSLDPWRDIDSGNYKKMTQLRLAYPNLKFSLGIGGWNEGSKNYSELASSPISRKTFIASVLDFLREYEFDGFDLDWEFPGSRGGAPKDKENFVALVKELKEAFRRPGYFLTAAISANKATIDVAYDVPEISKYLDYIHVMAYDYHGTWDMKVLPNSPLKSKDGLSLDDTIKYLLSKGAPASKLVLGLAMYGRTFILASKLNSPDESPINQRSLEEGFKGPFTGEKGFMGYNEICQEFVLHPRNWTRGWDDESSTAYAVKDEYVIVYDNPRSMRAKIEYIMELNLAGVMVWSIDTDDFLGKCASLDDSLDPLTGVDFPLMRSINMVLANYSIDGNEIVTPRPSSAVRFSFSCALILVTLFATYF